jgi:hypothetical protein
MKPINIFCGQNGESVNVKAGGTQLIYFLKMEAISSSEK